MNKEGFTLVELLGGIVILSIILLIAVPTISNITNNQKSKAYNAQVSLILIKAQDWALKNSDNLTPDNGINFVDLSSLVSQGYVDNSSINDPRNGSNMNGCIVITYNTSTSQYNYSYSDLTCSEEAAKYGPTITYNGDTKNTAEVAVNTIFSEPTVSAKSSKTGATLNVVTEGIKKLTKKAITDTDGTESNETYDTISTANVDDIYRINYSIYDPTYKYDFKAHYDVTIVDKNEPTITIQTPASSDTFPTNGIYLNDILYVIKGSNFTLPTATVKDNSCGLSTTDTKTNNCSNTLTYSKSINSINTANTGDTAVSYIASDYHHEPTNLASNYVKNNTAYKTLNVKVVDSSFFNATIKIPGGWAKSKEVEITYQNVGTGSIINQYSRDNSNWNNATNPQKVTYTANGNIYARTMIKGTLLTNNTVYVGQIDTTAPTFSLSQSQNGGNGMNIIANAGDSESGLNSAAYSFDGGGWTNSATQTVYSGGYHTVAVRDAVDNRSTQTTYVEQTGPSFNVTSTSGGDWVEGLTLTINASDSGAGLYAYGAYSFDNGASWTTQNTKYYQGAGTVYIAVKDAVGNVSYKQVVIYAKTQYMVTYKYVTSTSYICCNTQTVTTGYTWNRNTCTVIGVAASSCAGGAENFCGAGCDWSNNGSGNGNKVCYTCGYTKCIQTCPSDNYATGTTSWQDSSTSVPSGTPTGIAATRTLYTSGGVQ